jgi:peptidoglycan/xylan/chitin deacetylase (PgdA/CDA1 family)
MNLPILMYHHLESGAPSGYPYSIPVATFERHLNDIQRWGYQTITFHELFEALSGKGTLPSRPVIISFDDAYTSVSELAIPLLRARAMKATIFAIADFIGRTNEWDTAQGMPELALMDSQLLKSALADGMELGSHTCTHPNLTKVCDSQQEDEISRSKLQLEAEFGQAIEAFCYPYGGHTQQMQPMLERSGYRGAVSIFSNEPDVTGHPYQMRRVYPHAADSSWRFRLKLSRPYLAYVARRDRAWTV